MTVETLTKSINKIFLRQIAMALGHERDAAFTRNVDDLAGYILDHGPEATPEQKEKCREVIAGSCKLNFDDYADLFAPKQKAATRATKKDKAEPKSAAAAVSAGAAAERAAPTEDLAFRLESVEKALADVQGLLADVLSGQKQIANGLTHVIRASTQYDSAESLEDVPALGEAAGE